MIQIAIHNGLQEPFHAPDASNRAAPVGMRRSRLRKALPPGGALRGAGGTRKDRAAHVRAGLGLSFCHRLIGI